MSVRERRAARHTILLVGEGATERAFLSHVKTLYITRGCGVSAAIRNAHGKGPDHVVRHAVGICRNASYDRVVVLLDGDIQLSATVRRLAKAKRVQILESTPCFEGLLLKVLGEHVPGTSRQCKAQLGVKLPERLTRQEYYKSEFPKGFLDARRDDVPELDRLLAFLQFE